MTVTQQIIEILFIVVPIPIIGWLLITTSRRIVLLQLKTTRPLPPSAITNDDLLELLPIANQSHDES